jgi:hypothetical protein
MALVEKAVLISGGRAARRSGPRKPLIRSAQLPDKLNLSEFS